VTAVPERPSGFASRFNVSRESWSRLETFVALLLTWQDRINLIGPATIPDVWERHIADSLQLLSYIPEGVTCIADLGSGGGLPGIVLACLDRFDVYLYESNGKKAAFLQEALRQTKGRGRVHQIRLEALKGRADLPEVQLVTARALAPLNELLNLAEPFLSRGATGLFHKGADIELELTQCLKSWKLHHVKHSSLTDSAAVILEVREARRVA
jgi:16S rRNA (guanine527-N7)-methyltransferase